MKMRITALVVFDVLAAFAVASAGGQAQWDERAVQGGVEFRLLNDEGSAFVLQCTNHEVHASFVFVEPIEAARGALVISRGPRRILPSGWILPETMHLRFPVVAQVSDRTVQVVSGRGLASTLVLLEAATNIHLRTAGRRASFEVADSDSMLARCPGAEAWLHAGYYGIFDVYQGHGFDPGVPPTFD